MGGRARDPLVRPVQAGDTSLSPVLCDLSPTSRLLSAASCEECGFGCSRFTSCQLSRRKSCQSRGGSEQPRGPVPEGCAPSVTVPSVCLMSDTAPAGTGNRVRVHGYMVTRRLPRATASGQMCSDVGVLSPEGGQRSATCPSVGAVVPGHPKPSRPFPTLGTGTNSLQQRANVSPTHPRSSHDFPAGLAQESS